MPHKAKIVVFGNESGLGGAQTAFRELVDFLLNRGFSVAILSVGQSSVWSPAKAVAMRQVIPFSGNPILKALSLAQASIRSRMFAPDLFLSIGLSFSSCVIARSLSENCYKVCQDFIYGRPLSDPCLNACFRVFDGIAMQSPSMVEAMSLQGRPPIPVEWLPCFAAPIKAAPPLGFAVKPSHPLRLAYFGRLAPNKGLSMLLQCFHPISETHSISLDIWGEGSESEVLRDMLSSTEVKGVRMLGAFPDLKTPSGVELLQSYDAVVLPSTGAEGLPLILLEAMAAGVPFLATSVGAIPDCCNDNPDCVMVSCDPESLSAGILLLIQKLSKQQFDVLRLQDFHRRKFSPEAMASRWDTFLSNPTAFFDLGDCQAK